MACTFCPKLRKRISENFPCDPSLPLDTYSVYMTTIEAAHETEMSSLKLIADWHNQGIKYLKKYIFC